MIPCTSCNPVECNGGCGTSYTKAQCTAPLANGSWCPSLGNDIVQALYDCNAECSKGQMYPGDIPPEVQTQRNKCRDACSKKYNHDHVK